MTSLAFAYIAKQMVFNWIELKCWVSDDDDDAVAESMSSDAAADGDDDLSRIQVHWEVE